LFSYQIAEHVRDGRLRIVLRSDEHAPLPIRVVVPQGRLSVSDMTFKQGYGAAHCRGRSAELAGRSGKAAFVERGDEDLHRIDAIHRLLGTPPRIPNDEHSTCR
jgi:hypothetical protein